MQIQKYTLPFTRMIPFLNTVLSVAVLFVVCTAKHKFEDGRQPVLVMLAYFIHLIVIFLLVISATYLLSDVRGCRSELQWKEWFQHKNEAKIRSIQNQLHCCGFNSMLDRAWPFPAHDIDAATCQRTSGFSSHCATGWVKELRSVAVLNMIASILQEASLVSRSRV